MKKIFLVLITLAMVTSFASCGVGAQKIDMRDYVTVTYDSFNGYATADIEVDKEGIMERIDNEKLVAFVKEMIGYYPLYGTMTAEDLFDFNFAEEYENLSNGDKIELVVDIDSSFLEFGVTLEEMEKALGIKVSNKNISFKVEGLEEANLFDIFADIENIIKFEGANGFGTASVTFSRDYVFQQGDFYFSAEDTFYSNEVDVIYNNKVIGEVTYYCDTKNLSNGEKVVVTTKTYLRDALEEMGYIIPEYSKEYTVSGLGDYITSTDQLTDEVSAKVFSAIEEKIYEKFDSSKVELAGFYIGQIKPGKELKSNAPTEAVIIFKYQDSWVGTTYCVAGAYDIIVYDDGEISAGITVGSSWSGSSSLEAKYNELNHDEYVIEEIKR